MHESMDRLFALARSGLRSPPIDEGRPNASVARALNVSPQTVQNWIDRGVSKEGAINAANVFGGSASYILSGHPLIESFPENGSKSDDLTIRQYDAAGSMGSGLVLSGEQPGVIRRWEVSKEWAHKNLPYYTTLENLAIVTGFGDSMLGMFNPGDPILVDRGITKCDVDGVYFFRVDGEGFIKRLQRIPGEGVLVISENPKYRDWTIKQGMDFQVLAKVLTVWKSESF